MPGSYPSATTSSQPDSYPSSPFWASHLSSGSSPLCGYQAAECFYPEFLGTGSSGIATTSSLTTSKSLLNGKETNTVESDLYRSSCYFNSSSSPRPSQYASRVQRLLNPRDTDSDSQSSQRDWKTSFIER